MRLFRISLLLALAALCPQTGAARSASSPHGLAEYDRCHAIGKVLSRIASDDGAILERARRHEQIFRNLAYHTRRADDAPTAEAIVETLRARIKLVKTFAGQFKAAGGAIPESFIAEAADCAGIYARIARQPQPSPAYLWPKWQPAGGDTYGQSCGDPVKTGGPEAGHDSSNPGAAGVALGYYWLNTLRDTAGKPVAYERKGSGHCADAPGLGIVDFWTVNGEDFVLAPYASGMPLLPVGFSAEY